MKEMLVLLSDPVYGWEVEKEYIWQDDAACAFSPPTLFEVAQKGDPITEGLKVNEIKDLNAANLEAAKKICDSCPVWDQCYLSADIEDFQDTMRAGIMPVNFNSIPHGRPGKSATQFIKQDLCRRGHDDWIVKGDARRCRVCINISQLARYEKAKKFGKRPGPKARTLDSICPECGQSKWMARKEGGLRCQPCATEKQRIRRGGGRAARIKV